MRVSKIVFVFLVVLISCDTKNNVDPVYKRNFIKYYGDEGAQSGADLLVTRDGGMILLGNSLAANGQYTAIVIKVDKFGNVIWQRQLGGLNETAVDVEIVDASSDQLEIVAVNNVGVESGSNIRILRFNEKTGAGIDSILVMDAIDMQPGVTRVAKSITPLGAQGGFLVTGYADKNFNKETDPVPPSTDERDLLALKINATFDEVTNALQVGGETKGALVKAFEIDRDVLPLVMFGYSDKPVTSSYEMNYTVYLPESSINAQGATAGSVTLDEELCAVVRSEDARYFLMAGTAKEPGAAGGDIYLVKYSDYFDLALLNKRIPLGMNLVCVDAAFTSGSDYLIVANEIGPESKDDIVIVKADRHGEKMWTRSFGTDEGDDTAAAIEALPDGRIAVVGTIDLETNKKLALIVLDNRGGL